MGITVGRAWPHSLVVAALACMAPAVRAAPASPSASDGAKPSDALAEGRRLIARRQFAEAVAAFERAAAASPDDPVVLSELGWAALRAGKLERALEVSRRAVAVARDAKLKAASLYNLGRAEEALGQRVEARASYGESLKLRRSRAVAARLASLASAASRSIAATTLKGPFRSIAAYCKEFVADSDGSGCAAKLEPFAGSGLAAPFRDIGWFESRSGPEGDLSGGSQANLAIRTDAGWFIAEDLLLSGPQGDPKDRAEATFKAARVVAGTGQPGALAIEYHHASSRRGEFEARDDGIFVCGIGTGGPACAGPISATSSISRNDAYDRDQYIAKLTVLAGPSVSVKVKKRPAADSELDRVLDSGTYHIAFP